MQPLPATVALPGAIDVARATVLMNVIVELLSAVDNDDDNSIREQ